MTTQIASVAVAIGADLTGLSAGLAQAQSKIKAVGDKLGDIGKRLTTFVTVPIIGLGVAVTKMAINWESDFAGVEKTVDGTAEQLAALEDQLLRTSRQIPITPEQIAKISELGGQLGVQIGDIDAFAQEIA
ncbi:MAG TPA: phage tail tape measure protein, partial [Anaerolineae bacterium]|nr:phage tail tape measure protein [Anaerolineae bacterium]